MSSKPTLSSRQWALVPLLLSLGGLSCRPRTAPPPAEELPAEVGLSRAAVLQAVGVCALSTAEEFRLAAEALLTATLALESAPSDSALAATQSAFRAAMDAWQRNEVMRFGPAAARTTPGGQGLRDGIYAWPLMSRCAVEEQLVEQGYLRPDFDRALVNRRGLGALEYLLFYDGADTACGLGSPAVASGGWAALSAEERAARKRVYARVVAQDLRQHAVALTHAWSGDGNNFLAELSTAGAGSTVFSSSQAALNAVSDAMFYLEREVKDLKLAGPLGLRDCAVDTCPELLESPFAGSAKANLAANLGGFRRLAEGCEGSFDGVGFDDLLQALGAEAVQASMTARLAEAQRALDAIEEDDLREALAQDRASVRTLYDGVKGVTDLLKTDFISVLDLELPKSLEGDND